MSSAPHDVRTSVRTFLPLGVPLPPEQRKGPDFRAFSVVAGGGIRPRDLRVMRSPRGGQVGPDRPCLLGLARARWGRICSKRNLEWNPGSVHGAAESALSGPMRGVALETAPRRPCRASLIVSDGAEILRITWQSWGTVRDHHIR